MSPRADRLCWLLLLALPIAAPVESDEAHRDERSVERFTWECHNEIGRREVTLFANGTVRLRSGPWHAMGLGLAELDRQGLAETLRELDLIRRSPSFPDADAIQPWSGALAGPGSEQCRIHLELPGQAAIDFDVSIYDATPHALARLKILADGLATMTREVETIEYLPKTYEPRPDDVLRTASGALYRVIGLTSDRRGVELERLDQPLRVFHAVQALGDLFVAVEGHGIDPDPGPLDPQDLVVREPENASGGSP
ncbi:MAG: hypothetical protein AAGE94_01540 [Acidobacteriota bacterium]